MAELRIAQVGCGGMGLRHMYGEIELQRVHGTLDLVALCDFNRSAADHVASVAEEGLGRRPNVYTSFDEMVEKEKDLDAVDIVTDVGTHHKVALKAFDAGLHVAVEKPLGVTVRACHSMIDAAERAGKVLSVSENYRRDPLNRLVRAVLDSGAIGDRRLMLNILVWGTQVMPHTTAWRHLKSRGGYLLDYGVHETDLFLYFMGEVDTVHAETHLWEKERYSTKDPLHQSMVQFYGHRVKEEIERSDTVTTDSEDMVAAVIRFKSGAMGHFAMSIAAPGERTHEDIIYCSGGSVKLGGSRSGRPSQITRSGEEASLAESDVLDLVPDFELNDLTAPFFGDKRRLTSYDMTFPEIDRTLLALELQDMAESVIDGREPEIPGQVGLDAVALVYAILESGHLGAPVSFADVAADRVNAYQQDANEAAGL